MRLTRDLELALGVLGGELPAESTVLEGGEKGVKFTKMSAIGLLEPLGFRNAGTERFLIMQRR
jgi:hypothetical protein